MACFISSARWARTLDAMPGAAQHLLSIVLLLWAVAAPSGFAADHPDSQTAGQASRQASIPVRPGELVTRAGEGDAGAVARLLAAGVDPNARDRNGNTALILAADKGYIDVVRVLLERGAAVKTTRRRCSC